MELLVTVVIVLGAVAWAGVKLRRVARTASLAARSSGCATGCGSCPLQQRCGPGPQPNRWVQGPDSQMGRSPRP